MLIIMALIAGLVLGFICASLFGAMKLLESEPYIFADLLHAHARSRADATYSSLCVEVFKDLTTMGYEIDRREFMKRCGAVNE